MGIHFFEGNMCSDVHFFNGNMCNKYRLPCALVVIGNMHCKILMKYIGLRTFAAGNQKSNFSD
jgi:hypothetical protein